MGVEEAVGIILGSQVIAPLMALDWPVVSSFSVTRIERLPRGLTQDYWGWGRMPEPEELPERIIIRTTHGTVGVDLEEKVLASVQWSRLLESDHMGSAAIGVAIFGLPGLILTSPVLFAAHGGYAVQRALTGMDRHTWAVWLRLKGALASEDFNDVHQAFLNHCNGVEDAYCERIREKYDEARRQEKLAERFDSWKDDYCEGPFMDRLAHGCAEEGEVMKDYEDWQKRQTADWNVRAWQWLGMTEDEFRAWHGQQKTVMQLLEERQARKNQTP